MTNAIESIRAGLIPVVAELTDEFFLDHVTVKERGTPTQDSTGQETQGSWENVVGLVDLRALILTAVEYSKRINPTENVTYDIGDYVIMLGSYQTGVTNKMRVVSADGDTFEVFGTEWDAVNLITRLFCRRTDPGTG